MTSQYSMNWLQWAWANRRKLQSVFVSVSAYVGTLQSVAALENGQTDQWKHAWDLILQQPMLVIPGVISALIAGWRTSEHASKGQVRREQRFSDRVNDAVEQRSIGD